MGVVVTQHAHPSTEHAYTRDYSIRTRARSALAVFNLKERVFRGIAMLVFVLVFPFVFVFLAIYRGVSLLSFRREKKEE